MANVPIIHPRINPVANQEQYQRAPTVNTAPLAQGGQAIAGALGQAAENQQKVVEFERKEFEKAQRFEAVRTAQESYIATSGAMYDAWGEIAKLGGKQAELESVPRMQAVFQEQLELVNKIENPAAANAARNQLMSLYEGLLQRAQGNALKGRNEDIETRYAGLYNAAQRRIIEFGADDGSWENLANQVRSKGAELGWNKGRIEKELLVAKHTAANGYVDKMITSAKTHEDYDRAIDWVKDNRSRFERGTASDVMRTIQSFRNAHESRVAREHAKHDDDVLAEGAEVLAEGTAEDYLAWSEKAMRDGVLKTPEATQALGTTIHNFRQSIERKADAEDLEKEQLLYWRLRESGKAPKTLAEFRALGITDNVGLITWALGEEEGKKLAREQGDAFESAVADFAEYGYEAFTQENLVGVHGMTPEGASKLVGMKLSWERNKQERDAIAAEQREAKRLKLAQTATSVNAITAKLNTYKTVAEMNRDGATAAVINNLEPWAKDYVKGLQNIVKMNLLPNPPSYASTLKEYVVGTKDKDSIIEQMVQQLDLDDDDERRLISTWADEATAHMKRLESLSHKGVEANAMEVHNYFNDTLGRLRQGMDLKQALRVLIPAGANAGTLNTDNPDDAAAINKKLGRNLDDGTTDTPVPEIGGVEFPDDLKIRPEPPPKEWGEAPGRGQWSQ